MTENGPVQNWRFTVVHGWEARMDELAEQLARQLQVNPEPCDTDEIHPSRSWLSSPTIPASFNWLDGPEFQKEPGVLDLKILDLSQPRTSTAYISIPHAISSITKWRWCFCSVHGFRIRWYQVCNFGLPTYQRCAPGIEQPKKCAAGGPGSPKLLPERTSLRSHRGSGKAKQLAGDLAMKSFRFCEWGICGWVSWDVMRGYMGRYWGSPAKMSINTRKKSSWFFSEGL